MSYYYSCHHLLNFLVEQLVILAVFCTVVAAAKHFFVSINEQVPIQIIAVEGQLFKAVILLACRIRSFVFYAAIILN